MEGNGIAHFDVGKYLHEQLMSQLHRCSAAIKGLNFHYENWFCLLPTVLP